MPNSGAQLPIIDVEASGFGPDSYPIEVGLALSNGIRYCRLIKPHESWTSWCEEAEAVHGITREVLSEYGGDVTTVANELNTLLQDKIVYCDGWVVDEPWIIKLYGAANIVPRFKMYDIVTLLDETSAENWHHLKNEVEGAFELKRHRASNDAYVIQQTFSRSLINKNKASGY